MKRNIFVVIVISVLASGCGLLGSSTSGPGFNYRFKTSKNHYPVDSTLAKRPHIKATFINKSNQTLYLGYQTCVLVGLERLQNSMWEKVSIPVFCPAVVRGPVRVKPGQSKEVGIDLAWWTEPVDPLLAGTYRFTLLVRQSGQNKFIQIASNSFVISY